MSKYRVRSFVIWEMTVKMLSGTFRGHMLLQRCLQMWISCRHIGFLSPITFLSLAQVFLLFIHTLIDS